MDRDLMLRLIPEAREFEWVEELTPLGWLQFVGSPGQAIAYAELFWPSFVEHDGCIFMSRRFDQNNFESWLASTGGNKRAVEAVCNHTHILDLFTRQDMVPTQEQVICLGRLIKETWQAKLDREFPGRRIVVSFPEEVSDDLLDYEVTFFQEPTLAGG